VLISSYLALISRLVFNSSLFFWSFINRVATQYGYTVMITVLLHGNKSVLLKYNEKAELLVLVQLCVMNDSYKSYADKTCIDIFCCSLMCMTSVSPTTQTIADLVANYM